MSLSEFTTLQLVEELSKRDGVERVNVAPHTQTVEVAVFDKATNKYPHDKMDTGPCVVLVVTD